MTSFLQLLAQDIVRRYGTHFEDLTIIFPNKRAGLFLAEALSHYLDKPAWMPEIFTLAEYIERQTGFKNTESLPLTIRLYKSYCEVSGSTEKFEDFYFWGNMLLDDFDDIDKYLVDARDLFSNLVALQKIEDHFSYLTPEQITTIRRFWSSFNPEKYSNEQLKFLNVWDKLAGTYQHFKNHLLAEGICYEGMNERLFCEQIDRYNHPQHLLFAGFNALNKCEKQIFSYYRDLNRAIFYWDYDLYYTAEEHQEAGLFLRENLKLFPNALDPGHFNNFRYNKKKIEYISVPSTVGQAKLLPQLTEQAVAGNPRETAIVLCDEQLLIPVMHSIPEHIHKINITMGYPANHTAVAALITLLCDLKNYAKPEKNETYYYYKPVIALLNHKFIKNLCPDDIHQITNYIHQKNIVYITEKSLQFHPLTQAIFSSGEKDIPAYLLKILNLLISTFLKENTDSIEKEFLFVVYTQIQNLKNTFEEEAIFPDDKLYIQLLHKIIGNITIPFSGEPLEGLQLMGLQETRMLDFKNLIILSANEGILPKTTYPSSFIPYNLRVGFRLPTPENADALYAYYFYRLLQRANNIKILYASGAKGLFSGEMSRFLYQIKYESGLAVKESNFQNEISTSDPQAITIEKTEEIQNKLKIYRLSAEKAISPSSLNTYLECQVKFYFKYIACIKEKEEIAEELDHRLLGNIFHECSQSLYATIPNGKITAEVIDALLQDEQLIETHIRASYLKVYDPKISKLIENGSNELILNVIKKYIRAMLTYDKKNCPFNILAMETRFHVPFSIGKEKSRQIYIGGFIDRVDQTKNGIRIIDYKTGADTTAFKSIASVFDPENTTRNKAAFQTMLYCLMFGHIRPSEEPLIPGIYSTKLIFGKDYDFHLQCDKDYITDFRQCEEEFRTHLTKMLEDLFLSPEPFRQTTVSKKCKTCSYSVICRK